MKVLCYSSFTFSYLNRARVLFESLKRFHPDWHLVALMTDKAPEGFKFLEDEPFDEIVWQHDLSIPNLSTWLFKHDVVEVCTAVKGPFLRQACDRDVDVVMYLDPDTCLFNSLQPLIEHLETHDILLTPHLLEPEKTNYAVMDNEMSALWAGIYNLGFVAVRTKGDGLRFADWWSERLSSFCYDDVKRGLFVDQKWCDLAPAFFKNLLIVRDPGYNVASWNVGQRKLSIDKKGDLFINADFMLRFWHFTKLGPVGDSMTQRYAKDNFSVYELWRWYRDRVMKATSDTIPDRYWAFGAFADGTKIDRSYRLLYRDRADLQKAFTEPFEVGDNSYQAWLRAEGLWVQ